MTSTDFVRLIPYLLQLLIWAAAMVLAVRMYVKNQERPELLFLIATALILFDQVLVIVWALFIMNAVVTPAFVDAASAPLTYVREGAYLAGVVLLILAFWLKFKAKN